MALVRVYCGISSVVDADPVVGTPARLTAAIVDDSGRLLEYSEINDDPAGYAALTALFAERFAGSNLSIAVDSDDLLVTSLLAASGRQIAFTDDATAEDFAEHFAEDGSLEEVNAATAQHRAVGLALALQAGALSANVSALTREFTTLKPILAAHAALAVGRQAAAVALREVLRELYPAALRAYPDPASPVALAMLDALPEPGLLTAAAGRGRDAAVTVAQRLVSEGVCDNDTALEAVTALRVAITETPRRNGATKQLTAAVAEAVRASVAAVRSTDAASQVLIDALATRVPASVPVAAPVQRRRVQPTPISTVQAQPRPVAPPPVAPAPVSPAPISPAPVSPAPVPVAATQQYAQPSVPVPSVPVPSVPMPSVPMPSVPLPGVPMPVMPQPVAAQGFAPLPGADPFAPPMLPGQPGVVDSYATQPYAAQPYAAQAYAAQPGLAQPGADPFAAQAYGAQPGLAQPGADPFAAQAYAAQPETGYPANGAANGAMAANGAGSVLGQPVSAAPVSPGRLAWSQSTPPPTPPGFEPTPVAGYPALPTPRQPADPLTPFVPTITNAAIKNERANRNRNQARTPVAPDPLSSAESRASWPLNGEDDELEEAPRPTRVTPPWQADDLVLPSLRLVEPDSPTSIPQPSLRLVEDPDPLTAPSVLDDAPRSGGGRVPKQRRTERAATPPVENDDTDLLIFASVSSAWFSGDDSESTWNSVMDTGWRAAEEASLRPSIGGESMAGLPQRVPQANLVPGSPLTTERPLRIVRDAGAIAQHTSSYFRGWRRGSQETGGYAVGGRPGRESANGWDFTRDSDLRDDRGEYGHRAVNYR
ncbi:MAG TPA: hypothetical protein VFC19_20630 [Candidatus Limnocylindrales bacterium]|nr:hypothetical protein [Candidatus Limnocylindrales bacterium]